MDGTTSSIMYIELCCNGEDQDLKANFDMEA
jgi:hypothetical protein